MHLHQLLPALPLVVAMPSCHAQSSPPGSPETGPGSDEVGAQLAQYPGAPFEDREGNLWFSTVFEGLIRFDGESFVTFTTADGLADDSIRDIVEDEDGVLWIATTGGVSLFDDGVFRTLTDYGDTSVTYGFTPKGNHRDIWDIEILANGDVWITTLDGVFRYDGTAFVPFPLPVVASQDSFEFTSKMVYCIFEDESGALWFGTDGAGAVSYDGSDWTVYTMEDGLCSNRVSAILQDSRGDYWFGTSDGGVSRWDGSSFSTHLRSATFSEHTGWGRYLAIFEDRAGFVWFGVASAGGGVHRWDGTSFRYFSQADGLGDGGVPSIGEDRSGRVWFGTTAGVFGFDGERFTHFTKK